MLRTKTAFLWASVVSTILCVIFLIFRGRQYDKQAAAAIEQRIVNHETILRMNVDSLLREYLVRELDRVHGHGDIYTFFLKLSLLKEIHQSQASQGISEIARRLERQISGWTLERYESIRHFTGSFRGRGIVATADDKTAPQLINTLITLRRLGCALPVQVFHHPDHGPGQKWIERLAKLEDVSAIPISRLFNMTNVNYTTESFKLFAILASTFNEIIYMDGDVCFVRNPECLFAEQGFKDTGSVFFRDRTMGGYSPLSMNDLIDKISPDPPSDNLKNSPLVRRESHYQLETAVMAIDKQRHIYGLLAATRLVTKDDPMEVWKYFQPHKECFWLGMEFMAEPYYFMPRRCGAVGVPSDQDGKKVLCGKMAHQDGDGRLFWFMGFVPQNNASNPIPTHFVQEGQYASGLCLTGDIRPLDSADQATITTILGSYDPDPLGVP